MKKPKRPRDVNQLAKLIIDLSTGVTKEEVPTETKNPHAIALGLTTKLWSIEDLARLTDGREDFLREKAWQLKEANSDDSN